MRCGHVYHELCLNEYATAKGCSIWALKCAMCGTGPEMTQVDVEDSPDAVAAFGHVPAVNVGAGGQDTPVLGATDDEAAVGAAIAGGEPEPDAEAVIDGDDVDEGDDVPLAPAAKSKPKAKGKAKAKSKSKGKSPAKAPAAAKSKAKRAAKAGSLPGTQILGSASPPPEAKRAAKAKARLGMPNLADASPPAKAKATAKARATAEVTTATDDAKATPKVRCKAKGEAKAKAAVVVSGTALANEVSPDADEAATGAIVPASGKRQIDQVQDPFALTEGRVLCESCKRYCHFAKCRQLRKTGAGSWRCGSCGVKHVQLRRAFGSWPTDSFALLSEEQRCHRTTSCAHQFSMRSATILSWCTH